VSKVLVEEHARMLPVSPKTNIKVLYAFGDVIKSLEERRREEEIGGGR